MCQGPNLEIAQAVMEDAKQGLDHAIKSLENPKSDDVDRLLRWFGVASSSTAEAVRQRFINIRAFTDGAVFLCSNTTHPELGDVYAYVRSDKSFAIVLGIPFFKAPHSGFNSKMGIMIHEMSHFYLSGATNDPAYGVSESEKLAKENPIAAQKNADNYEYYVESLVFGLK